MQEKRIGLAVKRFNHSATLSDQREFNGKLNQNNKKLKQRCLASNRIFFLIKTKKPINKTLVRSKRDLTSVYLKCIDELSTLVLEQV